MADRRQPMLLALCTLLSACADSRTPEDAGPPEAAPPAASTDASSPTPSADARIVEAGVPPLPPTVSLPVCPDQPSGLDDGGTDADGGSEDDEECTVVTFGRSASVPLVCGDDGCTGLAERFEERFCYAALQDDNTTLSDPEWVFEGCGMLWTSSFGAFGGNARYYDLQGCLIGIHLSNDTPMSRCHGVFDLFVGAMPERCEPERTYYCYRHDEP